MYVDKAGQDNASGKIVLLPAVLIFACFRYFSVLNAHIRAAQSKLGIENIRILQYHFISLRCGKRGCFILNPIQNSPFVIDYINYALSSMNLTISPTVLT